MIKTNAINWLCSTANVIKNSKFKIIHKNIQKATNIKHILKNITDGGEILHQRLKL